MQAVNERDDQPGNFPKTGSERDSVSTFITSLLCTAMPDVGGDIRDRHVGMGNSPGHGDRWAEPVNKVRLHSTV